MKEPQNNGSGGGGGSSRPPLLQEPRGFGMNAAPFSKFAFLLGPLSLPSPPLPFCSPNPLLSPFLWPGSSFSWVPRAGKGNFGAPWQGLPGSGMEAGHCCGQRGSQEKGEGRGGGGDVGEGFRVQSRTRQSRTFFEFCVEQLDM